MRFTTAFVSSLLSVPAVLAISPQVPSNVAGVRMTKPSEHFEIVSGNVDVPHIDCGPNHSVAYVGVALDNPSNCPVSFEVGVALRCEGGGALYQPYWVYFPDPVANYVYNLTINEGDKIHIEVVRNSTGIEFFVANLNASNSTGILRPGLGPSGSICGDSVSWTMRTNVILYNLQPIPKFTPVKMYALGATSQAGIWYGPQSHWNSVDGVDQDGGLHGTRELLNIGSNWTSLTIGGPGSDGDSFEITWEL